MLIRCSDSRTEDEVRGIAKEAKRLLGTRVRVVDSHGNNVCCADADSPVHSNGASTDALRSCLRIPLVLESFDGEILVENRFADQMNAASLTRILVEMLISQAATTHEARDAGAIKERFIHRLLQGVDDEDESTRREAEILGMDLDHPRAVILIDASSYITRNPAGTDAERGTRMRVDHLVRSITGFFSLPSDTICGYIGNGEIVILKASSSSDLERWSAKFAPQVAPETSWADLDALKNACTALLGRLRRDADCNITIGIGRHHPGLSGIARSYQDARTALALGRHFHGENQAHALSSLGLAAFVGVADSLTKFDLANYLLCPLDQDPYLVETLETFFAHNCCPTSTAKVLSIHRNTVGYRLQKVASLIGLNPSQFEDAVQIRLALALRSLHITSN